ncbi:MAG: hypothetical protein K8S56_10760 [Candidatus Cloacimonetes bacterium]|nr:hypothetical protein [Candidatus Cloacimonadota bacterium]
MKRIILFLFIVGVTLLTAIPLQVYNANPDTTGITGVSVSTFVSFYITDLDTTVGVDMQTITVDINGTLYSMISNEDNFFWVTVANPTGYRIIVEPIQNFGYNTVVAVEVNASDLNGFAMPPLQYSFTTVADALEPWVDLVEPEHGDSMIAIDTDIVFRVIDWESGVNIYQISCDIDGNHYTQSSPEFTYQGNIGEYLCTIDLGYDFDYGDTINIEINASDMEGNAMDSQHYWFSTFNDIVVPYLSGMIPYPCETEVSTWTNISFNVFDLQSGVNINLVSVQANSEIFTYGNFEYTLLTDNDGFEVGYNVVVNPFGDPHAHFNWGDSINVIVNVADNFDNATTFFYHFFTHTDNIPPSMVALSPSNGQQNAPIHPTIQLDLLDEAAGVDTSSVVIYTVINGTTNNMYSNDLLSFVLIGNPDLYDWDYRVSFDPGFDYNFGDSVFVHVDATDYSNNSMVVGNEYYFIVETNHPPVMSLPTAFNFDEDEILTIDFNVYASDPDPFALLSLTASNYDAILLTIDTSVFSAVTITNNMANWNGTFANVLFTVTDEHGASVGQACDIDIMPVNDAPTIILPPQFSFAEDDQLIIDFDAAGYISDPEGDLLTLTASGNTSIIVSITGTIVTLTANAEWNGQETITFTVFDDITRGSSRSQNRASKTANPVVPMNRASAFDDVLVIVTQANDAPQINLPASFSFNEDETLTIDFNAYATDPDPGAVLSVSASNYDTNQITIDTSNFGSVTITNTIPDWNGTVANVQFTVTDENNDSDFQTCDIIINPVNDAPTINLPALFSFPEDGEQVVDFAAEGYISDLDGDALRLVASGNNNIFVEISGTVVTFTGEPDWNGEETIMFTVFDDVTRASSISKTSKSAHFATPLSRASAFGYVVVRITSEPDPLQLNLPAQSLEFDVNNNLYVDFLTYITNPEAVSFELVASNNINVAIEINGSGVTFSSIAGWIGEETITFTITDENDNTNTDSDDVVIKVNPTDPNIAPQLKTEFETNYSLKMNGQIVIDFKEAFVEPTLPFDTYTLTVNSDYTSWVEITNTDLIATISPPSNWVGEADMTFLITNGVRRWTIDINVTLTVTSDIKSEQIMIDFHTLSSSNSFSSEIYIFTQEEISQISGKILNRKGKLIKDLVVFDYAPDSKKTNWKAKDNSGNLVKGGFYIYQFNINGRLYQGSIIVAR